MQRVCAILPQVSAYPHTKRAPIAALRAPSAPAMQPAQPRPSP